MPKVIRRPRKKSKKDKDIPLFVAFCIEEYEAAKRMTGTEALGLFRATA